VLRSLQPLPSWPQRNEGWIVSFSLDSFQVEVLILVFRNRGT